MITKQKQTPSKGFANETGQSAASYTYTANGEFLTDDATDNPYNIRIQKIIQLILMIQVIMEYLVVLNRQFQKSPQLLRKQLVKLQRQPNKRSQEQQRL